MGKMLAIKDLKTNQWNYFVTGSEREAKITPLPSQAPGNNNQGVAEVQYGSAQFYLYDHLGNTRITFTPIHEDQVVTGKIYTTINNMMDYYPYGKILREYRYGDEEKFLTTQHQRDIESGLDYRGARYYDSDVARFLSIDPLASKFPAWSSYNYVMSNPIMLIDPTGREAEDWVGKKGKDGRLNLEWNDKIQSEEQANAAGYDFYADDNSLVQNVNLAGEQGDLLLKGGGETSFYKNSDMVTAVGKRENNNSSYQGKTNEHNLYKYSDDVGQLMNAGGVVWGASEMGGQYLRQNDGAKVIGRSLGFGTQQTARALRGTVKTLGAWGKNLGTAGMVLSSVNYVA